MGQPTDADREAQRERSRKYGISILPGGSITKPAAYADVPDDEFADPVNYNYPMDTADRCRAALRYWGQRRNQSQYSADDRAVIEKRMRTLAARHDVEANFADSEPGDSLDWNALTYEGRRAALAAALSVDLWAIRDMSDNTVIYEVRDNTVSPSTSTIYQRQYAIVDGQIMLGEPIEVVGTMQYKPAATVVAMSESVLFADDAAATDTDEHDEMVEYSAKLFEAGEYPDKAFAVSPAELEAAAAAFTPVDNNLEHSPSILDGKLGKLVSVAARGKELFGRVQIPRWLKAAVGDNPIRVSLEWDRHSKRIVGNALVLNPRIPDAQLIAAFTAAQHNRGGSTMPITEKQKTWWERLTARFSREPLPEAIMDADPENVTLIAEPAEPPASDSQPTTPTPAQETPQAVQFSEAERAELEGLRAAQLTAAGEAFANQAIADRRALPAERSALVALYRQAVLDDNAGRVTFGADGAVREGQRVRLLRDLIAARPAHNLTTEELAGIEPESLVVMSAAHSRGGTMSAERRAELRRVAGLEEG